MVVFAQRGLPRLRKISAWLVGFIGVLITIFDLRLHIDSFVDL